MPLLELQTNAKLDDPKAFIKEFSEVVFVAYLQTLAAELLKTPLEYICVNYKYSEHLAFAGTFEPALLLSVASVEGLDAESNALHSQKLFGFFEKKLGVKDHRGYIVFVNPSKDFIGFHSTTAAKIFASKPE
ncbi:hypothetical protein PHLCEN_2v13206 [Hermanssonia centrifuga]|uniref:L-dopachrome isomerase n=1 Tax=Hermanssonia centrifuga TaxID=98765 RepID=A0A2R6NFX6_9APHY|nr:hypothetical protein PHLCEN_2v13206 [Hermanssonia centrifuga]